VGHNGLEFDGRLQLIEAGVKVLDNIDSKEL
jgi:hypothetical protein